jgi:hypothetical protein
MRITQKMKKPACLLITVTLALLITSCTTIKPVSAQYDFNAFLGNSIANTEIDGTIGNEWNDAGNYTNVAINPQGTAEIWTKHDGTYIYIAIRFTADSDNPWVALQLGNTDCMTPNADGVLFGHDGQAANGYRDISFGGYGDISADSAQDGTGAMTVSASTVVTVELKKPLNSGDSEGKDVEWSEDNTYALVIMWDSDGGGSSGGSVSHKTGTPTARTMFINPDVIPEFPGLIFLAVLAAMAIATLIFKRGTSPTQPNKAAPPPDFIYTLP